MILPGLFLQMLMNAMETIGVSTAARISWAATGVAAHKDTSSITSGISVLVGTQCRGTCFSHHRVTASDGQIIKVEVPVESLPPGI